jgi:glycosyltransferase involved in cell wall biosynthesis
VGGWRPELVQYNTNRPFGEAPLFALARAGIPIVYVFHEAWLICARLMLLRSPGREQCDGPSLVRCTECVYSHYDLSHARALAKLPWRFARFGVTPLYRYLRRRRARGLIHAGLAYSEFMARVHSPHLSAPVHHVPFGINLDGLPARPALRRHRPLRFGFVGGLQDTKGIGDVLTATAELAAKGHDFEVHVWGPGVERRGEQPASKEPTGRVVFRSMYGLGELWDVYSQMDVALMATTVREPFGRVPLEAAAMGVPSIAPAVGGIVETIRHDVDGLLYAFGDAGDLGRQMGRLLDEPGLLERLAANLRAPLDTRTQVPVVESLYLRLLEPGAEETAPPRRRS